MNIKRLTALFIILFSLIVLFACNGNKSNNNGNSNTTTENTAAGEEAAEGDAPKAERIYPDIPAEDFGGYTFNILHWYVDGWKNYDVSDVIADELTGDAFNDAVFNRTKAVEDKYNVNIEITAMDIGDVSSNVQKMVSSGDDAYDLVYQRLHDMPNLITSGYFYNLIGFPYLDFDKPWWDKKSIEELSIAGKAYMASSDLSFRDVDSISCLLFNKKLAQNYALENLYEVVARGDWTMDYMMEICRGKSKDLNNNGVWDEDDFFPYITGDMMTTSFFNGAGSRFADKDADDLPYCSFMSERNISVCEKILDFMYNNEMCFNIENIKTLGKNEDTLFQNNQCIFVQSAMEGARRNREMEADFGILPIPKYDKNQDRYYSTITIHGSSMISVPVTAADPDRTGIIIEALSAESRYTTVPAYYDLALIGKYIRDDESEEILDLLFETRLYDLGAVYKFGDLETAWLRIGATKGRDVVSLYDKKASQIERSVNKIINQIEALD